MNLQKTRPECFGRVTKYAILKGLTGFPSGDNRTVPLSLCFLFLVFSVMDDHAKKDGCKQNGMRAKRAKG